MNRQKSPPRNTQGLPRGEVFGHGHRIESVLGQGGFGITYKAFNPEGQPVAIKEYLPEGLVSRNGKHLVPLPGKEADHASGLKYFKEEAETLRRLPSHPNIVGVRALFEKNRTAYMVMDFIDGQPMSNLLGRGHQYNSTDLTNLLGKLTMALGHLHDQEVLHLDIKPQNIMIRKGNDEPVLIDFGAARNFSQAGEQIEVLTEGYAPIELLDSSLGNRGPWSDFYSLGVVGYIAATGNKPPSALNRVKAIQKTGRDPLRPCLQARRSMISNNLATVIDHCLNIVPNDRPLSARDLASLLRTGKSQRLLAKRFGPPKPVGMEQITRSVKIVHLVSLPTPPPPKPRPPVRPRDPSAPAGGDPIHAVPVSPKPQRTRPSVDWALVLLSLVAFSLIVVIGFALSSFSD